MHCGFFTILGQKQGQAKMLLLCDDAYKQKLACIQGYVAPVLLTDHRRQT